MEGGLITGNINQNNIGGAGVRIDASGEFTMEGGTISGNSSPGSGKGGGVLCIGSNPSATGTFTYNGGSIKDNTAGTGGQVYMECGTPSGSGNLGSESGTTGLAHWWNNNVG